jgi:hypothetical protein
VGLLALRVAYGFDLKSPIVDKAASLHFAQHITRMLRLAARHVPIVGHDQTIVIAQIFVYPICDQSQEVAHLDIGAGFLMAAPRHYLKLRPAESPDRKYTYLQRCPVPSVSQPIRRTG